MTLLSGTIYDEDSNVISNAEIEVYDIVSRSVVTSTTADINGVYNISISVTDAIVIAENPVSHNKTGKNISSGLNFGLTLLDTDYQSGEYYAVWGDGTYIYTACELSGLMAYSFNGTTLTHIDTDDQGGEYYGVWGDGTYIYTACGTSGLMAYSFNGTILTFIDADDQGDVYQDVWGDGTYIYAACGASGLRAYSFNGTTFTFIDADDQGGTYYGVWGDGTYIYVACGADGVRAYSFNGTTLTFIDADDQGDSYYGVWTDGTYIHTACGNSGIRSYSFNGTTFSLVDSDDSGSSYFDVWGDGDYIYVPCGSYNLKAYLISSYEINIIIEEYTTLNITSTNYESRLRYCPVDELNHTMDKNIDVVNFWTDEIEAVDEDINSESVNISGVEYATTASDVPYLAYKFEQIWKIMEDDEEITIDDIDDCYNGVYVIKNFEFSSIQKCANAYTWNLSLERVRDV